MEGEREKERGNKTESSVMYLHVIIIIVVLDALVIIIISDITNKYNTIVT